MLRGIHKASANWLGRAVMGVILGLIAISFGIWGIGDIFRGFGQSTVAKVGGTEIRVDQFRQLYQDRLQQIGRQINRPVTPDQARALGIDRQVLAQTIAEMVVDERARSLRLGLSDAEIARRITEDPNFKGMTGEFDRLRFEMAIRQAGYTEARFLAEQRRSSLRAQLVGALSAEPSVPKTALDALNRYQNEQRTIEYVVLKPEHAGELPQPTPEVLSKYFEERKVLFRAPEYRKLVIVSMTPTDVAATVEVSDAEIKKAYDDGHARFATPERRHVQQIVFPNMDEARAAADKLAKGTTFAALAAERGLKDADIDLGTLAKSAIVDRAVADAAFALKAGEVSAPIDGRFGIALAHVVSIEPSKTRAFAEVSADLKREIATDRAKSEIQKLHDKLEDERLAGTSLTEAAAKLNLKPRTIEAVDRTGKTPDGATVDNLPTGVDLLSAAFTADLGGDNDPLRVPGGNGYVWFDVQDVKASRERPLDEVKDLVLTRWREDEIAARLKAQSAEMLEKLKAGTSFADMAAAAKAKPEWLPGLKRSNPPAAFAARGVEDIFRTRQGGAGTIDGAVPTERIVFQVSEVKVPTLEPDSADIKRIDEAMRRAMSDDIVAQYVARLESEVGVTINQSALNQVTGAAAQN